MDPPVSKEASHHSHSPTTVFASLHRKSRSTEAANPSHVSSREARDAAVKEAKRYLHTLIRNDWFYEPSSSGGQYPATPAPVPTDETQEWREREQDTSCSDTEDAQNTKNKMTVMSPDPYRFESPDAVEYSILERKRKRRKLLAEEMQWNAGLRIWSERRDAWTGAKLRRRSSLVAGSPERHRQVSSTAGSTDGSGAGSYIGSDDVEIIDANANVNAQSESTSSTKVPPGAPLIQAQMENIQPGAMDTPMDECAIIEDAAAQESELHEEPLVPVARSLLPDTNPVRASITPAIYPSIYSKVVIQSLTPAIPINLADVTKALVQGWKADGEWPPKPTVTQDAPVVKKKSGSANANAKGNANANPPAPSEPATKPKRLSSSGVAGAVKKVLAGIHPGHRFHIRSGSHSHASQPATGDAAGGGTQAAG